VGVNALIYAGGEGIGFSIPSRLASKIVERIKAKGYVERGYIGAVVQPLTDDLAASFGLSSKEGALVGDALADAPASLAGIKPGDVIVEFDGHPVKGVDDLTALASESDVGKMVKVAFIRDQKKMTLDLTISRLDDAVPDNGGSLGSLDLGLILRELTPDSVGRENLPEENGLLVERIMENSPAQDAGVFVRDLILEVDRQSVRSLGEYYAALRSHPRGGPVLLWLKRGGRTIYRTVPLPGQKSSADQDD
jgi:serine protease Do